MTPSSILLLSILIGATFSAIVLIRARFAQARGETWLGLSPPDVARPSAWAMVLMGTTVGLEQAGVLPVVQSIRTVRDLLHLRLISLSGVDLTPIGILTVAITISAAQAASRAVQAGLDARTASDDPHAKSQVAALQRLAHYGIMALGGLVGLQLAGVNLSALLAASAVFAVGIGFGLQTVAKNFVSGLTLLVERTIKPGDTLEIEGRMVQVVELGIRATVVRTTDNEEIIVPNGILMDGPVTNHTLHDPIVRVRARVGVEYGSTPAFVEAALLRAGASVTGRVSTREPVVLFTDFGQSALEFEVSIWTDMPFERDAVRSRLRSAIHEEFRSAGIAMAFPKLDVRFVNERKGCAVAPRPEPGENS